MVQFKMLPVFRKVRLRGLLQQGASRPLQSLNGEKMLHSMELKAKGEGMEGTEREMRAVRCCKLLLEGLVIMLLIYELFFLYLLYWHS